MGYFDDTAALWKAVETGADGIPCESFLTAAYKITEVFDSISGMGMVKTDMVGNADKIKKNMMDNPGKTLQQMIGEELANAGGDAKKACKEGSTCLALLWLKRYVAAMRLREVVQPC